MQFHKGLHSLLHHRQNQRTREYQLMHFLYQIKNTLCRYEL